MVDVARASRSVAKLTALKFFPADKEGRSAIVQAICQMATSNEQIDWVVKQMLVWYNDWPGPREMRGVFCQRWKPADGGPNINYSAFFAEGFFPGCEAAGAPFQRIEAPEAGRMLAEAARPLEIEAAPIAPAAPQKRQEKTPQLITQAQIDAAVVEMREKRARGEFPPISPEVPR